MKSVPGHLKGSSPFVGILFQTNDVRLGGGRVRACSFGKKNRHFWSADRSPSSFANDEVSWSRPGARGWQWQCARQCISRSPRRSICMRHRNLRPEAGARLPPATTLDDFWFFKADTLLLRTQQKKRSEKTVTTVALDPVCVRVWRRLDEMTSYLVV